MGKFTICDQMDNCVNNIQARTLDDAKNKVVKGFKCVLKEKADKNLGINQNTYQCNYENVSFGEAFADTIKEAKEHFLGDSYPGSELGGYDEDEEESKYSYNEETNRWEEIESNK